jgi:hypothetical protein
MEDNTSPMDAIDRGHIIPLCIGGPRRRTRYFETKHPWNLGINTSSNHPHWEAELKEETEGIPK